MSSENRELELADKNMIIKHVKSIKKYSKEEEKEVLEKYKTITDEEEKIKMRNEIANHYLDKILAICFMYKKGEIIELLEEV